MIGLGLSLTGQRTSASLASLLFGMNEPGFTFEPWDITTLYQDRAGTTPVTAAGQSVGLRLSKDQGLRQGPEVNPDPGFDNPAAWTFGGATPGWAVTGGKAECTATAGANRWVSIPNLLTVGATYLITADVIVTSGGCVPDVSANAAGDATTSGTKRWIVTASTSTLQFIGRSNFIGSIDNVSFKTLAGNHEVAVSDAKRGVYGWMPKTGRRNLLTYTEDLTNAAWTKNNATVGANETAPSGAVTQKIVENTANTTHGASFAWNFGAVANAVTISFYAKAAGRSSIHLSFINTDQFASFNLSTGVATRGGYFASASMSDLGNGWYRCVTTTIPFDGSRTFNVFVNSLAAYTGDGSSGVQFGGAQLEVGSTATAYQRVVSQYDITEAGVPTCYYVQADGVDDCYVTPTITPNTDKVQVFAGMRKLSDAATGIFIEHGTNSLDPGTLYVTAPELTGASGDFRFKSRGSVNPTPVASGTMLAPTNKIITGLGDISGDTMTLRVNGAQVAQSTSDQGTGNFLAYPAYIYGRGGTSLPFNGLDFGHAVRFGPNLDAATIARVESLIARNTPEVTL